VQGCRPRALVHLHGRCPRKCPAALLVDSDSSARHGCTASASLAITTQSVSELRQLVHRKRRSFRGNVASPGIDDGLEVSRP
jgi:hypothetical protein